MLKKIILSSLFISQFIMSPVKAATEIQWWHAMGGPLSQWVMDLAVDFNSSQSDYVVVPVYKGNYTEVMNAAITAFRANKQPHLVQVFEVGTATMMSAKGAVYPVHQLMKDTGQEFNQDAFLPSIVSYYSTSGGEMLSLPFNSSTPVLYYNRDAFVEAGLDPNTPPKTWEDVEQFARKTQKAGYPCGITIAWQSWVLLENFSAWHDIALGTKENGFNGFDAELKINSDAHVQHIQKLAGLHKEKVYEYGGRKDQPMSKFVSGECAMFISSSGAYAPVEAESRFSFGVGMMPYWASMRDEPQNSIIGGATLWVLKGHESKEYKGVAAFLDYLSSPKVQAKSHQRTGYLPVTKEAYKLSKEQSFYTKHPGKEVAIQQLMNKEPTPNSKGLRFGNFVQIRDIINEELELVWSGKKTAKEALDSANTRANKLLRKFERRNKK